jgi:hypothetical protein
VQPFSGQKGMKRQTGVVALLQACVSRYINEDTPPRNSRMGPQQQESRAEMKRLAAVWPPQGSEWVHHSASTKAVAQRKNNNKKREEGAPNGQHQSSAVEDTTRHQELHKNCSGEGACQEGRLRTQYAQSCPSPTTNSYRADFAMQTAQSKSKSHGYRAEFATQTAQASPKSQSRAIFWAECSAASQGDPFHPC